MSKPATTKHQPPCDRRTAREVNCGLAAMAELYTLSLACDRNGGSRTCHVLPAVDAERLTIIERAAKYEGFEIEIEARGDGTVVTLSRRA